MSKFSKNIKLILSSLLLLILVAFPSINIWANDGLIDQTRTFYVNDEAGILTDTLKRHIIGVNANFENTDEKPQVVVATVKTLNDMDIDEYAYKLFEKFKIGNEEYDNGILILLAPNERKIRIEVGYGLEGCISDAKSGKILDSTSDLLSNDNYPEAIDIIFENVCNEIAKEYEYNESIFTPRSDIIIDFSKDHKGMNSFLKEALFYATFIVVFIIDVKFNNGRLMNFIAIFTRRGGGGNGGSYSSGGGGGRSGGGGASRASNQYYFFTNNI